MRIEITRSLFEVESRTTVTATILSATAISVSLGSKMRLSPTVITSSEIGGLAELFASFE